MELIPVTRIDIIFCTVVGSSETAVVHFMISAFDLFGKYSTVLQTG